MSNITEMLDRLADYQAQRDLAELDKQKLLEQVIVPQDVLMAQADAQRKRQEEDRRVGLLGSDCRLRRDDMLSRVKKPALPAEYLEAMAEYSEAIEKIKDEFDKEVNEAQSRAAAEKARIDAALTAQTQAIYDQIAIRKLEIEAEFEGKAGAVDANITALTAEIKAAVIAEGKTVKGSVYMAKYVKGRDGGWDTAALTGYAAAHPEILPFRKPDGAPSVSICKV